MGYKLRVPYAGSTVQVNDILEKVIARQGAAFICVASAAAAVLMAVLVCWRLCYL